VNILKKNIFLILNIFLCLNVVAQQYKKPQNLPRYDHKKIHFGFTLGINELNFNLKKNSNTIDNDSLLTLYTKSQKGFNLGIVSNFRIGKYADLRFIPALIFGERHLEYTLTKDNETSTFEKKIIESTLIDFPISIKYKSERYNNFRTYLLAGIKYSMDIASQDKIDDEGEEIIKLKKDDLLGEVGFGIDFYLEYFKFSPEIKLSYGFLNIISKDDSGYTKLINDLNTNGWMLSFTFE
tara:strand:- start:178 stop:891 length:714 start_codon:yes stop_codon:yes gene_type:complete